MSNDCWHLIAGGGEIHGTINIIYKMFNFVFGKLNPPAVRNMLRVCGKEDGVVVIDWRKLIYVCLRCTSNTTQPLALG